MIAAKIGVRAPASDIGLDSCKICGRKFKAGILEQHTRFCESKLVAEKNDIRNKPKPAKI
jgi:hypothetical protein